MGYPTIRYGGKNDRSAVKKCQQILISNGFLNDTADGIFGRKTDDAVDQFQASANLHVDGIVGSGTWARLLAMESGEAQVEVPDEKAELRAKIPAGTSGVRLASLEAAIGYLGAKEVPNGSNRGPVIDDLVKGYNAYWQIGGKDGYPWCAMATSTWIALALGLNKNPKWGDWKGHPFYKAKSKGGAWLGGASQCEEWGKANGRWATSGTWPAGSLFTVARSSSGSDASSSPSAGHIGMIVCDNGDGTVTTVEGNVSNKVKSYNRKKSGLRGYLTWW